MNIMMMTNTFTPHVGGVARSVESFTAEYRRRGHRVLVVAPEFENQPEHELDVVRIPAIQHFNGSDFSVVLPIPMFLFSAIDEFEPDIVHSHHPFLIGATALRLARAREIPLVFTHHTMYEHYTHYAPAGSKALKRFVVNLSTSYANLCDRVFAPSESVAEVLRGRGVETAIEIVPTGVNLDVFARGSGPGFRAAAAIPEDAFVVGHVGRLAAEKNLGFLARCLAAFIRREERAHALIVGSGPSDKDVRGIFAAEGVGDRLHMVGSLAHPLLASAYQAMDVFAFSSKSETQGLVLTEAMAARVPVVAVAAPGAIEVVEDGRNGRLLPAESLDDFVAALGWMAALSPAERRRLRDSAADTAARFSMDAMADKALAVYGDLRGTRLRDRNEHYTMWDAALRRAGNEWDNLRHVAKAAGAVFKARKPDTETGTDPKAR